MLVAYDEDGRITHCTIQAECGFDELAARYTEMGIPHALYDGVVEIWKAYVVDGEVRIKPPLRIDGELRAIAADGADALRLAIDPPAAWVTVFHGDHQIGQEQVTDGAIEFAANYPGHYRIVIDPPFPFMPVDLTIEAT